MSDETLVWYSVHFWGGPLDGTHVHMAELPPYYRVPIGIPVTLKHMDDPVPSEPYHEYRLASRYTMDPISRRNGRHAMYSYLGEVR